MYNNFNNIPVYVCQPVMKESISFSHCDGSPSHCTFYCETGRILKCRRGMIMSSRYPTLPVFAAEV